MKSVFMVLIFAASQAYAVVNTNLLTGSEYDGEIRSNARMIDQDGLAIICSDGRELHPAESILHRILTGISEVLDQPLDLSKIKTYELESKRGSHRCVVVTKPDSTVE